MNEKNEIERKQKKQAALKKHLEERENMDESEKENARPKLIFDNRPLIKFFPGNMGQPCAVRYHFLEYSENFITKAIVFIRQNRGTSYINTDKGRDILINSILDTDFKGVRVEFIRFIFALESIDGDICNVADEFKVKVNLLEFSRNGNPHQSKMIRKKFGLKEMVRPSIKEITAYSTDLVAGSAPVFTVFEDKRTLSEDEIKELYHAIGVNIQMRY